MEENFTNSSLKETTESFTPLKLRSRVKPFEANNWDDIDSVRTCMKTLGCYGGQPVEHLNKCMMDQQLRSSIEKKQKEYGLTVDGTLFPSGETERALNNELEKRRNEAEEQAKKQEREMEDVKRRIRKEEEELNKPESPAQRMCMIDSEDARADNLSNTLFAKVDETRKKRQEEAIEEKRRKEAEEKEKQRLEKLRRAEEEKRKYRPNGAFEWLLYSNCFAGIEEGEDLWKHYKGLQKEKMDDGVKHRELSSRFAQKGEGWENFGRVLGLAKEAKDVFMKSIDENERKRYGGIWGILEDSAKDMKNNVRGFEFGKSHKKADCAIWARHGVCGENNYSYLEEDFRELKRMSNKRSRL